MRERKGSFCVCKCIRSGQVRLVVVGSRVGGGNSVVVEEVEEEDNKGKTSWLREPHVGAKEFNTQQQRRSLTRARAFVEVSKKSGNYLNSYND